MSYLQNRQRQAQFADAVTTSKVVEKYLTREKLLSLADLSIPPLDHLSLDLTNAALANPPSAWVSGELFEAANAQATECLELVLYVDQLYGKKVKEWVKAALKTFDTVLVYYIQEVRQEQVSQAGIHLMERDLYRHLKSCNHNLAQVGMAFDRAYDERNLLEHNLRRQKDGGIRVKTFGTSEYQKIKDKTIAALVSALTALDRERVSTSA